MEFLDLFIVALMPILKTLIVIAIGLFLALERVNLLSPIARQHLNNLVFYVFTPALVSSNLADTITSSNVVSLWFMPVNILLTFIIGSALGWVLVKITRTPKHLHGLVIGCCSAGAVCIWTYVYNIIRVSGSKSDGEISGNNSTIVGETSESLTEALVSKDSEDYEADQAGLPTTGSEDKVLVFKKFQEGMKNFAEKINLKRLFTPSIIATIIGLLVGVITPIRKIIIGDSAPLRVLESSAALVGEATIPSITLILGANLLKGLKRSEIGLWVVIGVNIVQYIALPLCGILVINSAHHFGLLDQMHCISLFFCFSMPFLLQRL